MITIQAALYKDGFNDGRVNSDYHADDFADMSDRQTSARFRADALANLTYNPYVMEDLVAEFGSKAEARKAYLKHYVPAFISGAFEKIGRKAPPKRKHKSVRTKKHTRVGHRK